MVPQGLLTTPSDPARFASALDTLAARHPAIAQLRGCFRVAANEELADNDHALNGGELNLITPVACGADPPVVLSEQPLSLDRCTAAVRGTDMTEPKDN